MVQPVVIVLPSRCYGTIITDVLSDKTVFAKGKVRHYSILCVFFYIARSIAAIDIVSRETYNESVSADGEIPERNGTTAKLRSGGSSNYDKDRCNCESEGRRRQDDNIRQSFRMSR